MDDASYGGSRAIVFTILSWRYGVMSHTSSSLRRLMSLALEPWKSASPKRTGCKSATLPRQLRLEPLEERALLSVTLVNNGMPTSTIVVAKDPTTAAVYAAAELQADIKQITGATVPIATDDQTITGTRILVGDGLATQARVPRSVTHLSVPSNIRSTTTPLIRWC